MKKLVLTLCSGALLLFACNKSASNGATISLSASSTSVAVGQTITVTATTSSNALSWSVTPASNAKAAYTVTTEKTNYISFSQPGSYTVGIRARSLALDSVHHCNYADSTGHHAQDSTWNHHIDSLWTGHGYHEGGCQKGKDSASVLITVK